MKRWYVTMTWDDFPEGGSFGTVIECETAEEAEKLCREEMAEARADEDQEKVAAEYWLETYGHDWHVIDCWDLDEFIERHASPSAKAAPQMLKALKSAADHILCLAENHHQKCPPGRVCVPDYITAAINAATEN